MLYLSHTIDPTVDFVFKKLLGSIGHEDRTCHFINSMLSLECPIEKIDLLNPFNEKDFNNDKLSIVDIKATDANGRIYQIEMQVTSPTFLPKRMLHNWANLYGKQIEAGDDFKQLQPVISIWLLTNNIIKASKHYHHHFESWDRSQGVKLSEDKSIHIFELKKWIKPDSLQAVDYWLYFIKHGHEFRSLPQELNPMPQMRQAMSVLKEISESEQDYHRYQARQEYLWVQRSEAKEKQELEAINKELNSKYRELDNKNQALENQLSDKQRKIQSAEEKIKQLEAELQKAGLNPPK